MSASAMVAAIRPVYGVAWNRTVVDAIATDRTNRALARIRNSPPPLKGYNCLPAMFLEAYRSDNSFPSELWAWRQTSERFRLDSTFGCGPILKRCPFLHTTGVWLPADMGRLRPDERIALFEGRPSPQLMRTFWSITRSLDSYPDPARYLAPDHTDFARNSMVREVNAHSEKFASTGKFSRAQPRSYTSPVPLVEWGQLSGLTSFGPPRSPSASWGDSWWVPRMPTF